MQAKLQADGVGWDVGGQTILKEVDLEIVEGECLAIIGPNGAGKTTLLRTLLANPPSSDSRSTR